MKFRIFTFLLFCVTGLISCRKDKIEPDIKTYDSQQILSYISSQGITGMQKDTVGGDTTGMYFKIITPGSGAALTPADKISIVFTLRTLDGKYISSDTINNHFYDYVGHIATDKLPLGLQTALLNDLKYRGASMRLLIPSHLAYGVGGYGSGSSQVANQRIAGNESLDYYVNVIGDQGKYDDEVIHSYMKDSSLTGYTPVRIRIAEGAALPIGAVSDSSTYYYKILTPATSADGVTNNSTITYTATGQIFNAIVFDDQTATTSTSAVSSLIQGVSDALEKFVKGPGTQISILIPSALGYGTASQTSIPSNSCLRFTFTIDSVSP